MRDPAYLGRLGLTRERLGPAFRDATILSAVSLGAMAAVGAAQGSLRVDETMLPLLVLYPAWGVTQQTLVQGMLTRHLATPGFRDPASCRSPRSRSGRSTCPTGRSSARRR